MKRIIKYIIMLLLFVVVIPSASALSFNNIRVSAVFTGSKGSSNVEKIEVHYTTTSNGVKSNGVVTLLKSDNFTKMVFTGPINELKYDYALAITNNNIPDTYGFLQYETEIEENYDNDYIDLTLISTFDNRNYDGEKYRANSNISTEDIDKIRSGSTNNVITTSNSGNGTTNKVTTTTTQANSGMSQEEREKIMKQREDEKEAEKQESSKLLIMILIAIGALIVLIVIYTIVKMSAANNRV